MTNSATTYFTHQDFIASKGLRDAYLSEADNDPSRAVLAACIDMAALKAYVASVEEMAAEQGIDLGQIIASRPVDLTIPRPRLTLVETAR